MSHSFPIRIYYEDTDAAGIVYYANYLKFAERARTEALRTAGINQIDVMRDHKIGFVVRQCVVNYLKPAKLDDLLTVESKLTNLNRASLNMTQTIKRSNEVLVELEIKLVAVNEKLKLAKFPEFVQIAMSKIFQPQ